MSGRDEMRAALPDEVGNPADQAASWLAYLYSGSASEEGLQAFSTWLRRYPANGEAFRDLQQIWSDLPSVEGLQASEAGEFGSSDDRMGGDNVEAGVDAFDDVQPSFAMWRALAAVLLVGLVGGGFWHAYLSNSVAIADYHTGIAEVRRVKLADGSVVTLSASSSLHAEMSSATRSVDLDAGRAFFDVAPDRTRPFTVDAGGVRVQVVGTEFDVNISPAKVRVSVARGVVEVRPGVGHSSRGVRLVAGQRVTTSQSGELQAIESFDAGRVMPWLRGMLVYRDEPLADVVADMNRYRTLKISIADEVLARMPITMAVRTDQTDALIAGLEAMRFTTAEQTPRSVVLRPIGSQRARRTSM
ncbi:FecR family protein [Rhizorhabdus dicambivorans]|nr:FecR domain-containing protein [Rhizorhabdus dicambivorans]